jgi:TonB family protein
MRLVFLFLLGSLCLAQVNVDAVSLIRAVSDSAKQTTSWQIEGSITRKGADATFALQMRAPNETRYEQRGGATPALIVCDSSNAWLFFAPMQIFQKSPASGSTICAPIVGEWKKLPEILESSKLAGKGKYTIDGKSAECQLIRGVSKPTLESTGPLKRTLCIDQSSETIVWEKTETKYSSETYVYSHIVRGVEPPEGTFVFEPPLGSKATDVQLRVPRPLGSPGVDRDPGKTPPHLISHVEPEYDQASRLAQIEGTVVLWVVIDGKGLPAEPIVQRSLSPGLDANAITAVKQWRFSPATKDGNPISIIATMEVNFRLR